MHVYKELKKDRETCLKTKNLRILGFAGFLKTLKK